MSKSRARLLAELLNSSGLVKKSKSALSGADEVIDLSSLPTITNAKLENASITIADHVTALGGSVTLNTGDIGEHTNYKYYTDARADARIVNAGSANWNTAYGWGNHASAGYRLSSESLYYKPTREASGSYLNLNTATTPGIYRLHGAGSHTGHPSGSGYGFAIVLDNSDVHGHLLLDRADDGRLWIRAKTTTSFATSDWNQVWSSADFTDNSSNWDTAYGWGNHASAGYVTSSGNTVIGTDTDLSFSGANVLSTIALTDGVITSYTNRVLTLANLGYTGETNATADQTQSEINALGITATGLSGTPNITVGSVTGTTFKASGSDTTPAGTTFANTVKGVGTNRTMYFDGSSSSVSTWYGVGNNPYAAIDVTEGILDIWLNPSSGTWHNVADFNTGGLRITYGQRVSIDSSASAYFEADGGTDNWKYLSLQTNGTTNWDIATKNNDLSGALQFRPAGSGTNRTYMDTSGNWVMGGEVEVTTHEFRVTSSSAYHTHLNYQNTGQNYISQATSGGLTQFRNSNGMLMEIAANGTVSIANNLNVSGNLTVSGTTTTLNTADLNVEDNNITLNYSTGDSSASANNAGITIQDAVDSTTDATILWNASSDQFNFSHKINITGNLQSHNVYSQDFYVLNTAGTGWHRWAQRSDNRVNLSVHDISSNGAISSATIHNTGVIHLGSTATASDQFAVNNGTDIFLGTTAKGLRTYKDLHTNSGNNKYWHAGNDGSTSGLDADTLDSYHASTTRNSANTIPVRDGNGYLNVGWINTTSGATSDATVNFYTDTGDNYIRKKSLANVRTEIMGVASGNSFLRSDANDTATGRLTLQYGVTSDFNNIGGTQGVTAFYAANVGGVSNRPDTGNYATGLEFVYHDTSARSQLAAGSGGNNNQANFYVRSEGWSGANGWTSWYKLFHTGNDGSSSGLDADTLDGQQGQYYKHPTSPQSTNVSFDSFSGVSGYYNSVQFFNLYTPTSGTQSTYNSPTNVGAHHHVMQFNGYSPTINNWKYQSAFSFYTGDMYTRNMYNTTWQSWARQWSSLNDGSSSGLDADTVDGIQGASFLRSDASDSGAGSAANYLTLGYLYNTKMLIGAGSTSFTDQYNNSPWYGIGRTNVSGWHTSSGNTKAQMAFYWGLVLRSGQSRIELGPASNGPIQFGDGGTDNWAKINSTGIYQGTSNLVWHAGNDGPDSGLDADTLDGLQGDFYFKSQTNNHGGWSQSNRNFSVRTGGNAVGLHMEESDGTFGFQLYGNGADYGFLDGEWGNWDLKKIKNGELYVDAGSGLQKVWHAGNDDFLMHYKGIVSGNWDTIFSQTDGHMGVYEVQNISNTDTNYPSGAYTYGGVLSWQLDNSTFKMYAPHTGSLYIQNGWNNDEYSGWREVWDSGNDGPNSGLDADTVDGVQLSGLARLGHDNAGEIRATNFKANAGGVYYAYTAAGNLRGYMYATDTNDEHLVLRTSGGEDIAFKDDTTNNMIVRGDGNVWIRGSIVNGTIPYTQVTGTPTTLPANGGNSDTVDGYHKADINPAHSHYRWTGIAASGTQARRFVIMRLYGTPAHWDSNWQDIHLKVWSESYEATNLKYELCGDYNGGNQNTMFQLRLKDAGGSSEHGRFRLVLGTPVDAGWDHSGQNTYYVDVYAEASHYMNFTVAADFYSAGFNVNTLPTSGGATTVVYSSPAVSNITTFTEAKEHSYFANHKIWNDGNHGSASGLDADLLDGQHGSYYLNASNMNAGTLPEARLPTISKYLRSDTADTGSGKITLTATEGLEVGGIRGRAIGDQSGDFIQLYERVNIGYPSGWGASAAGAPSYGLSTYGGAQFNTGNVSGAPLTFNGNTIWHAGNDGSGSGLDADTVDGLHYVSHLGLGKTETITVYGDTDKYYPVIISGNAGHISTYKIHRGYSEHGPNDWNTSSHKGGLSFMYNIMGAAGWGGYPTRVHVIEAGEIYASILGGIAHHAHTMKHVVWLRGGGSGGGRYHIDSNSDFTVQVSSLSTDSHYKNSTDGWYTYNHSNDAYDQTVNYRTLTERNTAMQNEIFANMDVYYNNGTVNHQLNGAPAPNKTYIHTGNMGTTCNADTVDSLHASSFARQDTNTTYTTNTSQYFRVERGTTLGSLSGGALQAYSTGNHSAFMSFHRSAHYAVNFGLDTDNVLRIGGWSAAANRWVLDMSGNMTAAGNITAYSDISLKENIEVIPNALEKVQKIRGVTFTRNDQEDKEARHTGVIAQEVEKVLPEVVAEDDLGIKNVAYGNMVGLLIEAVKELKQEVEDLKTQLKER